MSPRKAVFLGEHDFFTFPNPLHSRKEWGGGSLACPLPSVRSGHLHMEREQGEGVRVQGTDQDMDTDKARGQEDRQARSGADTFTWRDGARGWHR